jgi:hypothetical protein
MFVVIRHTTVECMVVCENDVHDNLRDDRYGYENSHAILCLIFAGGCENL